MEALNVTTVTFSVKASKNTRIIFFSSNYGIFQVGRIFSSDTFQAFRLHSSSLQWYQHPQSASNQTFKMST